MADPLAGGSDDGARARQVCRDLQAGTVWTNGYYALDEGFPE
ncbi:acyl-CoA reductase-like NAD-dependent aldehyde dehydrogenase, partial [Mycobacterium sp. AZCC_0083]|nr:acyl-CoA reductase-like NAD-dependent aldehyde dehydrogenase [Mycobacterium sp. AZCC_0083]